MQVVFFVKRTHNYVLAEKTKKRKQKKTQLETNKHHCIPIIFQIFSKYFLNILIKINEYIFPVFQNQEFLHEMGLEQRWRGLTTAKFHEIAFRVFLDT